MRRSLIGGWLILALLTLALVGQTAPPRPFVDPALLSRISRVAGFESERVNRHFYVLKNGGVTEVTVKDPADEATLKAIQTHLKKEAELYAKGNFENITAMYGKAPDSVVMMKKFRDEITYAMVPEENGAVIRMFTVNPQAKAAIHEYLKFQIDQLKTGDPTTPQD